MKSAAATVLALLLAACGRMGDLVPPEGTSLPPAPYGSIEPPDSARLLRSDPTAAPERNVELRRESEEREDDPFDLPPEG